MTTKDIRTHHQDVSCDVCGRTLLRGEQSEAFLAGGHRRQVCELCTTRAHHEGWVREDEAEELDLRRVGHERRRSLIGRLRSRRAGERGSAAPAPELPPEEAPAVVAPVEPAPAAEVEPAPPELEPEPAPPPPAPPRPASLRRAPGPRSPRHVRAVPHTPQARMHRAVDLFNASEHPRTVGGVSRSLGLPLVAVRVSPQQPSVVRITVAWELSWYRFEMDLADEDPVVRRVEQGAELSELPPDEQEPNAAADERGAIVLAEPPA